MLKGRPGFHFENWAKTYGCDPELYFEPTNESEVRQVSLHILILNKLWKLWLYDFDNTMTV